MGGSLPEEGRIGLPTAGAREERVGSGADRPGVCQGREQVGEGEPGGAPPRPAGRCADGPAEDLHGLCERDGALVGVQPAEALRGGLGGGTAPLRRGRAHQGREDGLHGGLLDAGAVVARARHPHVDADRRRQGAHLVPPPVGDVQHIARDQGHPQPWKSIHLARRELPVCGIGLGGLSVLQPWALRRGAVTGLPLWRQRDRPAVSSCRADVETAAAASTLPTPLEQRKRALAGVRNPSIE